jgi:hypothetical protein
MKKRFSTLLFLAAIVTSSCQNFPTVKVQSNFSENFTVNKSGTTFSETKLIDATTESEFDKYKHKINSIDIERVTYTIESSRGPANQVLKTGTLKVADESGTNSVTVADLSNVNLASSVGQEIDLSTSPAGLARIQELIKSNPHKAVISLTGTVNQGPINLNLTLKFHSKLTARVIGSN